MNDADSKKAKGFDGLPESIQTFVIDLNLLMDRAGRLGLWKTMHVLHDAKRKLGWELAEEKP